MDYTQAFIDILRAAHLVCFAAGMGTGLYFDFRAFQTFKDPLDELELLTLERLHLWISCAFAGLWVTGIALIYVRTSFDLAAFSPKLWLKLGLMTLMVWNSRLIGTVVIPALRSNLGKPMAALKTAQLVIVSQIAVMSMFGWTSGLMLGSSVVLKTAPWGVLLPLAAVWLVAISLGGQAVVFMLRKVEQVRVSQRAETG